jgi:hypothetical protein
MTTNGESGILQGIEKILVLKDFEEFAERPRAGRIWERIPGEMLA